MMPVRFVRIVFAGVSGLFCALGLALLLWPETAAGLCVLLGAAVIACGAVKLMGYFSDDLYRLAFQFDLAAGLLTARCRNKWLAPLPPVICNGLIVGALLAWYQTGFTAAFPAAFAFNAVSVGGAELLVCYVLGLPLLEVLTRSRVLPQRAV